MTEPPAWDGHDIWMFESLYLTFDGLGRV